MKEYDVIVVGGGEVGLGIVFKALKKKLKVALAEKGKIGGTCINVGCIPSKMLIYPADKLVEMEKAKKFGIHTQITRVDFDSIRKRMRKAVKTSHDFLEKEIRTSEGLDFYNAEGQFVSNCTFRINDQNIKGRKIFIATGARPFIPPIKGIDEINYLTNENVMEITEIPDSMIIIGGGYIAAEYGHFFSALGTKVTIIEKRERLLPHEEPEISELLKKELAKRMKIYISAEVAEVQRNRKGYTVFLKMKNRPVQRITAGKIFLAAGRMSNADMLKVERTGVKTDGSNYIVVDDYLQTNVKNIWALGDAIGKQMFTHAGDKEAEIAWHNATSRNKKAMDFGIVPHAVFTYPQIASVGLTEETARKSYEILIGKARYSDIVRGDAMGEKEGFAKAIVEKKTKMILGFHIIGPAASILIQEVVNAITNRSDFKSITESMHIFPALSELIPETLNNLE
ncbi:MAG: dihydrolipoyl dehydrogenase [Nitrospirae bacterium]|nr:dihydrolipoyl dehydrogenase [Nitrospirota bacterium]